MLAGSETLDGPVGWLERVATERPRQIFITQPDGSRITYREFWRMSAQMATELAERGLCPGDRVVAQVEKSVSAIALYLACLRNGLIYVPLNTAYKQAEVSYFIADATPRAAVFDAMLYSTMAPIARSAGVKYVECLGMDRGESSLTRHFDDRNDCVAASRTSPRTPAALLYTSGTTGRPKGALLTIDNLARNAEALVQIWEFTPDDVLLHALPLFHGHGLFVGVNTVLAAACSMVLLPKYDTEVVLRWLPRSTVMMGIPTFYTRLLRRAELCSKLTENVRAFFCGSAPLSIGTHAEFARRTGHTIIERYGMTETLIVTANGIRGHSVCGSVGRPLPSVEVRIRDAVSGAVIRESNRIGVLELRSSSLFCGYWHDPEKTLSSFSPDGFFVTGDLARVDADGYVYITGRATDTVITGGYNVYPLEIENELDGLSGVRESAVIGLPHPDFGEGVTAVISIERSCTLNQEAVLESLAVRLADYKVPKRVLFVDEIPRNALGKVQKDALRQTYAELYR